MPTPHPSPLLHSHDPFPFVQDCWATIRQHESLDYDAEELLAHNQRQADLTDFTLSIQRTKREQARQAASAAAPSSSSSTSATTAPPPPRQGAAPVAGRKFMPVFPGSRRTPAAAQRAVANSTLHPLLQIAAAQQEQPGAAAPAAASAAKQPQTSQRPGSSSGPAE